MYLSLLLKYKHKNFHGIQRNFTLKAVKISYVPVEKFSIMKTKLLHKSMVCSKLLSLLKDLSNPKSMFAPFPSCPLSPPPY